MLTGDLKIGIAFLIMIAVCYVAGRLHQWARHGIDRDAAFREGYDQATHSLFALATSVRAKLREQKVNTKEMPAPAVVLPHVRARAEVRPVPVVKFPSVPQSAVSRPKTRTGPRHAA